MGARWRGGTRGSARRSSEQARETRGVGALLGADVQVDVAAPPPRGGDLLAGREQPCGQHYAP